MRRTPTWRRYLRFWGPDVHADVDDELQFHVDALASELVSHGLPPDDARAEALRRFGNVERYRAALHDAGERGERAARLATFIETVRQDVAYALRTLVRAPVFTAVAVTSLALGIGANSAIFSLVDAILLRPLPGIREPDRLAEVSSGTVSYPDYRDLRDRSRSWSGLAAYRERETSLGAPGSATLTRVAIVSGNYFGVLGVAAARGRVIVPGDDTRGAGRRVAVISHGLWQRQFAGDPAVVGQTIQLNGTSFVVVGVVSPRFRGPRIASAPTVWIPINASESIATGELASLTIERRQWGWLTLIGRLAPGVSLAAADAEMDAAAERLRQLHDAGTKGPAVVELRPAAQTILGRSAHGAVVGFVSLLVAVVAIALLVACANVANLQLARAAARTREVSVRLALGAGRARLVRQLVTESIVLALAGGLAALLVSRLVVGLLGAFTLPGGVSIAVISSDVLSGRLLAFTFVVAVTTGVAFGLIPALRASKPELVAGLKDSQRASTSRSLKLRGTLVASQIALCLVLLSGAGLFVRSLLHAVRVDLGFRPEGVAVATFQLGLMRYDSARARGFYDRLTERLEATPGVTSVAVAGTLPFGDVDVMTVRTVGSSAPFEQIPQVRFAFVDGDYFRTMEIPIVRGRALESRDRAGEPGVAVISEAAAEQIWPGQDPIGKQFNRNITVVGVAADVRTDDLSGRPRPFLYGALAQVPSTAGLDRVHLLVRTSRDIGAVHAAIRREVRALDDRVPVIEPRTLDDQLAAVLLPQRVGATLLGLFGVLTLVLAAVGVYGVLASLVGGRTREIGIRVALGARPSQVVAMVLRQSVGIVAAGVVAGLLLALAATKGIASLLFGVGSSDPLTFGGTAAVLVAVGLAASYWPARRATHVNPTEALRSE